MLLASPAAVDAVDAASRYFQSRVTIQYSGNALDGSKPTATATSTFDPSYTGPDNVTDGILGATQRWAMTDEALPDGTYYPVDPGPSSTIGWYSAVLSDVSGNISPAQVITISFLPRSIEHLFVYGDTLLNQYPVDFTVEYLKEGVWYLVKTVTGNALSIWREVIPAVSLVTGLRVTITKVNKANKRVRILEVDAGLAEILDGEDVVSMDLLEEIEPDTATTLSGVSSNELDITLYNRDGKYSPSNTASPLYGQFKNFRKVIAELGIEVASDTFEYIPFGPPMYSMYWSNHEHEASFTARDILELLRRGDFKDKGVKVNQSAYSLFRYILMDYGISEALIDVDRALQDVIIPYAWWENTTHLAAIRRLAQAVGARVWVTRKGTIKIVAYRYHLRNRVDSAEASSVYDTYTPVSKAMDGNMNILPPYAVTDGLPLSDNIYPVDPTKQPYSWWGADLCAVDGVFTAPQTIVLTYGIMRTVDTWLIYGDQAVGDFPVHFKVEYLVNDVWSTAFEVTDNIQVAYTRVTPEVDNVSAIRLTIYKMSRGNIHAKIDEFASTSSYLGDYAVGRLDDDNQIFRGSQPIDYDKVLNFVEVKVNPRQLEPQSDVYNLAEIFTVPTGVSMQITLDFAQTPVMNAQAPTLVQGNVTINSWEAHSWGVIINVTNDTGSDQSVAFNVKGQVLEALTASLIVSRNTQSIADIGVMKMATPLDNNLIQEATLARTLADTLLQVYSDPAKDINLDVRGNPLIELSDRVRIIHNYKHIDTDAYVWRSRLSFDGALSGSMSLRRITTQ